VDQLKLAPSLPWKVGYVLLLIFVALLILGGVPWDWPLREWAVKHWLLALLGGGCLLGALSYPFKAVRLEGGVLRENLWFVSRQHALPARVSVMHDRRGRVVVANADSGDVIVSLAREFGSSSDVETRLKSWLRRQQRLA
jgi:hypothetical protein